MLLSLRRSKDSTAAAARRKKPDLTRCKRHPKHQQSPGVCSLCLREKLHRLCIGSGSSSSSSSSFSSGHHLRGEYYSSCSSSSSSAASLYCSSSSGSSLASPVHRYRVDGKDALMKSRSIASGPGFWSRLMSGRRGSKTGHNITGESGLKHSQTVREVT